MQDLIASYLVQKKECKLPLLGNFSIGISPATLDIADKKILPPKCDIVYTENGNYLARGFTEYIASLQNISWDEAEEKINNWCLHAKVKLDSGERIVFSSVGSLYKNEAGNILFEKEKQVHFFDPVHAERVIHKNEEHAVLVGDKETTSSVMNEFYREVIEIRTAWKKWAIALFAISCIILIIYFSSHAFSETGVGNQSTFPAQQPAPTYTTPR